MRGDPDFNCVTWDDDAKIKMGCANCNRDSHFLGLVCWWGFWMFLPVLLAVVAAQCYFVYLLVTA